ncbi:hypothetical protein NHQ30_010816 [Ciborinia camelliae]|nr:hypothetical protein NHQ30_010816 [Ciborinia camelliae]
MFYLTPIPGTIKGVEDWTLVDLTLGVVAASLPVLSAIIPKKWKSIHHSSHKPPSSPHGSHPLSDPGSYMRSKLGVNGKRNTIRSERSRATIRGGGTFGESGENIVRTDVIELGFQSKADFERGEALERGSSEGCGEGSLAGEKSVGRSYSRKRLRNRGDSTESCLDKVTSDRHPDNLQYGHTVEIGRAE